MITTRVIDNNRTTLYLSHRDKPSDASRVSDQTKHLRPDFQVLCTIC